MLLKQGIKQTLDIIARAGRYRVNADISNISLSEGDGAGPSRLAADGDGDGDEGNNASLSAAEGAISLLRGFADRKLEAEFSAYLNNQVRVSQTLPDLQHHKTLASRRVES